MSILTELPACGAPAVSRIEILSLKPGTNKIDNIRGTWYTCSEHLAPVNTAVKEAGLHPYAMGKSEGRCGDGMDYTVTPSVRLSAPAPSVETRAATGKKKRRKKAKKTPAVIWWRRKPCPQWCADYHDNSDAPADRTHLMKYELAQRIALTQHEPAANFDGWRPQMLEVEIEQHVDRVEPVVTLSIDGGLNLVTLTWDEVAQLRAALDQLEVISGG